MKMKETLQLGKTKFPMRGNLPNREADWQKEWEENKIYQKTGTKMKENQVLYFMMALLMQMEISI